MATGGSEHYGAVIEGVVASGLTEFMRCQFEDCTAIVAEDAAVGAIGQDIVAETAVLMLAA